MTTTISKPDPTVGISSFNNSETIASCRLWRRKIVTNAAAASFRSSGSLTAACSAIRRRTFHLNRLLNLRSDYFVQSNINNNNNSTAAATTKKSVAEEEFAAIHELIRLVGNVTFFDVLCRLTVKDADVVQSLGILLEYNDLKTDMVASIVRLFGNLCESKESAITVLQTKPCVRMIVHWMMKNLDDDLAATSTTGTIEPTEGTDDGRARKKPRIDESTDEQQSTKTQQQKSTKNRSPIKNRPSSTTKDDSEKLREHCIRTLRNAAQCGKNFAQYLIRSEAVYAVGRCLRLSDQKSEAKSTIRDYSFQFLQVLLPLKDQNFSQQLLRADILEKLMESAKKSTTTDDGSGPTIKLILGAVTHYSSLRCELSKLGAIEWLKERMERVMERTEWTDDLSKSTADGQSIDNNNGGDTLMALIRLCRDAYTRVKLRDTRALDLLLDIFVKGHLKESKYFVELMSAFLCFLYDDQGLKYLVEYDGFLDTVIGVISRYATDFPCKSKHLSKTEAEEDENESNNETESKEETTTAAASAIEFRADSPSYKRFRLDPSSTIAAGQDAESTAAPLCKDFRMGHHSWSSPSMSPTANVRASPSSPGPAWSPSASSLASLSSMGSVSPPTAGGGTSASCWSPTSDTYRRGSASDDLEYDWVEFDCGRRYSSCSSNQEQMPPALCDCEFREETPDESSTRKDRERLLWAAVKLVSWLSHSPHASLLINESYLTILVSYIAGVCRPEPRIGRLIERLTRNRQFTESLIELDFHRSVYDSLCSTKCGNGNEPRRQCVRCRKVSKIGHGLLRSLRAQVDTDFGFGTMEHIMAPGSQNVRLRCLCAMLYLTKSNWRVKRLMNSEHGGFNALIQSLSKEETDSETREMVAKAFYAGLDKASLRDRLKCSLTSSGSSTSTTQSSECVFRSSNHVITDENLVTFVSKRGDERIDCNMETLTALSPFYRAMFSGSYAESTQRHFIYDDDDGGQTTDESSSNSNDGANGGDFRSFVYYVHYLHGCRNCVDSRLRSADEFLAVLELADKRLCCSLSDFVATTSMIDFLKFDNLQHFVSNAILRRDSVLFRVSMDYLFAVCSYEEFLSLSTTFRTCPALGVEFFLMLTSYLKREFKFE